MLLHKLSIIAIIPIIVLVGSFITRTFSFTILSISITRNEVAGLWKLSLPKSVSKKLHLSPSPSLRKQDQQTSIEDDKNDCVILKINRDGSFVQCQYDENNMIASKNSESTLLKGSWDYRHKLLYLALDRPSYNGVTTTVLDTLFSGEVKVCTTLFDDDNPSTSDDDEINTDIKRDNSRSNDAYLSIAGDVHMGNFVYPKQHPSFYDEPMMFGPATVGQFQLRQVLGNFNTAVESRVDDKKKVIREAKFHKKNFYGRKFYLTVTPLPEKKASNLYQYRRDTRRRRHRVGGDDMMDIRIMPIEFLSNNTFSAVGINKILRGRYGTTGEEKDELWFQVSLFGAGRSMPGSVYSEGRGLTHDDQRSYLGKIEEIHIEDDNGGSDEESNNQEQLKKVFFYVKGTVTFGSDLGTDARPEPVGIFTLKEVLEHDDNFDDTDIEEEEFYQERI